MKNKMRENKKFSLVINDAVNFKTNSIVYTGVTL